MLGRSVFTRASTKAVNKVRHNSSYNEIPRMLMQNVWRKSTGLYVTYLVAGCVVVETIYGGFTNTLWNVTNRGVSCLFIIFYQ